MRGGAPIPDGDAIAELCGEASAVIVVTKGAGDFGDHNTKCGKDMRVYQCLHFWAMAEKYRYRGIE